MSWDGLINVGAGFLLGYALCLGRSAKRAIKSAEADAMRMYATSIRSLEERSRQTAKEIAERAHTSSENEVEMASRMAFAHAQKTMAEELDKMAADVET